MAMMHGSHSAPELRVPWILRALAGRHAPQPEEQPGHFAALPPQLSLDLIRETRERFSDVELRRLFRETAKAILADAADATQSIGLMLVAMATFVVRRQTLKRFLDATEMDRLVAQGYLKPVLRDEDETVLFVRLPELLASEASVVLGLELRQLVRQDSAKAAEWLVTLTSRIPLGEVIAAYAVVDAFLSASEGLPSTFLSALMKKAPQPKAILPGTKATTFLPSVGVVDITFQDDGSLNVEANGQRRVIMPTPDEVPIQLIENYHPWLILSHLAGLHLGIEHEGELRRFDLALLTEVGGCPHVLRRSNGPSATSGVMTFDIPGYGEIACPRNGIVEPITYALFKFLSTEGPQWGNWIQEAVDRGSLALLARIYVALRQVERLSGDGLDAWANKMLTEHIDPAFTKKLLNPTDSAEPSED